MRIKEIMSQPVVTCPADSTLDAAARLMWEYDCGAIPLVDHDGRLAGIITDRDICISAYTQGKPLAQVPMCTAMAKQVYACHADDVIESAEHLMRDNQVRRLPVVDNDGRPVGVVSLNDLARLAGRARRIGVDREIVETFAAVCQPRTSPAGPPRVLVTA